ncbi:MULTISPECIES: DNA repair protein RadA [unclassified Desulfovibrio]|uniref:DNA repair protein RadA n=1 Tax=unclassified Desulfovibrio TaxID=2593640 RepID=UPI000F5F5051|nr:MULTISPECIES: DNA repair protein RadA [unclassified Desulfovibrio]RRD71618.1 DNA repair protein RadA [Desulfovibrio sp. OH1209_COT-279]RRD87863.1 DNA repair protein RadA [Desulfovibrio sp. OH1186_COT-070]
MAKQKEVYVCSSCGAQTMQWRGQCPGCREWNTLHPAMRPRAGAAGTSRSGVTGRPVALSAVTDAGQTPYGSGLAALDRVLGKGLVPGAAILVGGEPGIGKSTLILQIAGFVAAQMGEERPVLYVSGEESLGQIKGRADRLRIQAPGLLALATSRVEDVVEAVSASAPLLLVVDSVQTLASTEAEGLPGNVSQVRAVATILLELCRRSNCTLVLVGHVTKDGTLAGPRLLEHMVDTVVSLEGDRRQMFRLLRVYKNRFGPNEELLVFHMGAQGMQVVDDPSTFFLGQRDASLSGAAVVMAVDGQRPLAVEIQALVSRTFLSIPRRAALGFDVGRLHLLLAVLEKRLKLNFSQVDIYAKVGGGIRLSEPGLDLALVAAVLSSYYDIPLPEKCVLWGEVDLNGQIRPVTAQHVRLGQARRLGFSPVVQPEREHGGISTVSDLQKLLFHRGSASHASGNRKKIS